MQKIIIQLWERHLIKFTKWTNLLKNCIETIYNCWNSPREDLFYDFVFANLNLKYLKYFNLKYIESSRIELRHIVTDNINQMMTISKSPIRILIIIFN